TGGQRVCPHDADRIHRQFRQGESGLSEAAQGLGDAGVFDGAGEQLARRDTGKTENREVVGFGGATGEDDLISVATEQSSGAFASVFQGLTGAPAYVVAAG